MYGIHTLACEMQYMQFNNNIREHNILLIAFYILLTRILEVNARKVWFDKYRYGIMRDFYLFHVCIAIVLFHLMEEN